MTKVGVEIHREVMAYRKPTVFGCDARCDKAWGIQNRPKVDLSGGTDPDDHVYVPDGELGVAPLDPGTYEGGQGKPQEADERLNKWCFRECERSASADRLEDVELPDLSRPRYNRFDRQAEADAAAARGEVPAWPPSSSTS